MRIKAFSSLSTDVSTIIPFTQWWFFMPDSAGIRNCRNITGNNVGVWCFLERHIVKMLLFHLTPSFFVIKPLVLLLWRSWRFHDVVIKWKHFPRYWPFVRGIRRSPVNYPHKGQWRGALMFSLICAWINAIVRLAIWDAIAPIMMPL